MRLVSLSLCMCLCQCICMKALTCLYNQQQPSLCVPGSRGSGPMHSKSLKAFSGEWRTVSSQRTCLQRAEGLTSRLLIIIYLRKDRAAPHSSREEARSAYNKGSTSSKCLKILSYILLDSSRKRGRGVKLTISISRRGRCCGSL